MSLGRGLLTVETRGMGLFSRYWVLGAIGCLSGLAEARAETLQEALNSAYARNPELEAQRALERASVQVVRQAKSAYGPTLSANAAVRYAYYERQTAQGRGGNDSFGSDLSLELSQALFTSGRLSARLDEARAGRQVARESLRAQGQQVIADVIIAYVQLRRDLLLYGVAIEIRGLLQRQHDASSARLRLHDATAPDVDQTENRLEIAAANVMRARASVVAAAARYRNVVGHFPEHIEALPELPSLPPIQELYLTAETSSPEFGVARYSELATRASLAAARADQGPVVASEVVGRRGPVSSLEPAYRTRTVTAGVTLSMPLYNSGLTLARIREAVERNRAAQQQVEQVRRDIREGIASNLEYADAAEQALPRYRAAVFAAERAVVGVDKQERAGIRTLRDVLDVTNDLLSARTEAARAEADLYLSKARVLRAAGLLEPQMFALSMPLQPDRGSGRDLAGLPLGAILESVDRLLISDGVKGARPEREGDTYYKWNDERVP